MYFFDHPGLVFYVWQNSPCIAYPILQAKSWALRILLLSTFLLYVPDIRPPLPLQLRIVAVEVRYLAVPLTLPAVSPQ